MNAQYAPGAVLSGMVNQGCEVQILAPSTEKIMNKLLANVKQLGYINYRNLTKAKMRKDTLSKFYAIRLPENLWRAVMAAGPNKVREVLEKMIGGKKNE